MKGGGLEAEHYLLDDPDQLIHEWVIRVTNNLGEKDLFVCHNYDQAIQVMRQQEDLGIADIEMIKPREIVDLSYLSRLRNELITDLKEVTEQIRQAVLWHIARGEKEARVARAAGVDRMTVRRWLGKRGQWTKDEEEREEEDGEPLGNSSGIHPGE
jgi:site-specific recombinase XerC